MFKKSKILVRLLAVTLAMVIMATSSAKSYAFACSNCWGGQMAEVCLQDKKLIEYGYHSYGLFWSKNCYARYYASRGGYVCPWCGAAEMWMDTIDGGYAYHLCYESHNSCSKGNYDVCLFMH